MKRISRIVIPALAIALPLALGACGGSTHSAPVQSQSYQDGYKAGEAVEVANAGGAPANYSWARLAPSCNGDPVMSATAPDCTKALANCVGIWVISHEGSTQFAKDNETQWYSGCVDGWNAAEKTSPAPPTPTTTTPPTEAQSATPVQVPLTQAQCQQFEGSAGWTSGNDYGPPTSGSVWDCGQFSWPPGDAPAQPGSPTYSNACACDPTPNPDAGPYQPACSLEENIGAPVCGGGQG
jgi:hypothetical protein